MENPPSLRTTKSEKKMPEEALGLNVLFMTYTGLEVAQGRLSGIF
jgi:hypothetical protein